MPKKSIEALEKEIRENSDVTLALAAGAAQAGGDNSNPALGSLIQQVLEKQLKRQEESDAEELRMLQTMNRNSAAAAAQAEVQKRAIQANCSHRNERGQTRVGGQVLSSSPTSPSRVYYTCQACGKEWWAPRRKESDEPFPVELSPAPREVGGATMTYGLDRETNLNEVVQDKEFAQVI